MALNIKNPEVERLAAEVARMAGETKTQAVRRALEERLSRLEARGGRKPTVEEELEWWERNIWSKLPPGVRGHAPTQEEQDEILGIGPHGWPE
jgi:antitoxin VapB